MVVFLWLGNNVMATAQCESEAQDKFVTCGLQQGVNCASVLLQDIDQCKASDCILTCDWAAWSNWVCDSSLCDDQLSLSSCTCTTDTNWQKQSNCPSWWSPYWWCECIRWNEIMTCTLSSTNNTQDSTTQSTSQPCTGDSKPVWWTINAFWICSCLTGQKNVSGVCKLCSDPGVCCGIKLNTSVPFIGKCIEDVKTNQWSDETSVTWATAFPTLMWSLTKILVTLILITSFVLIIIGGIMIATGNPSGWRKMIMNVVIGIALLGASGVILRLINPNFFG